MKPLCHIFEEIVSLENLFRAAEATLRHGRRFRGEGAGFKFNLEKEVLKLHEQLVSDRYRHGRYRLFTVWDPKVRVIAAASVRDRVLHHAVHDVIAPPLDRMFIHDSYACRSGKGTHRALDRAHGFLCANEYGLHLDVKSYFQSIDHEILKGLLRRYVADERALALLERIVDSTDYLAHGGGAGASVTSLAPMPGGQMTLNLGLDWPPDAAAAGRIRGVPLGNLTSQFFANLYLNELDQYVKHALKVRYYARYMDDMLMFASEKDPLLEWEGAIRDFARGELRLELHPGGGPRPVRRGIGFLGFRLFPGYRKLKKTSVTRFIRRMNGYTSEYFALAPYRQKQAALLSEIRQSTQSFHAHALHGDTYAIRKRLYDRFPLINALLREAGNGNRENAGRLDQTIGIVECNARVSAVVGSWSGGRGAGNPPGLWSVPSGWTGKYGRVAIRYSPRAIPERGKMPLVETGVGTQAQDGAGYRGGNWNNASDNARVSDRNNAANVNADRNNNNGSRAVRAVPSGVGPCGD